MKPDAVSIIIPAFNEQGGIRGVINDLRERIPSAEIVVVNDASTDDTGQIAADAGATVIGHQRQRGYGAALATGLAHSTRDYVLFCDADGQHTATDVGRLIVEGDGYDLVIGERTQDSHRPLLRRPGKLILKYFANLLAGESIPDLNSGLRLVRRSVLLQYIHLMPEGFSFSTTTTFAFMKSGRRIKYVPITVMPRAGESTVRQWKHGPSTMLLMLRLTVLFEPLKVFLSTAAFLFLAGILSAGLDILYAGEFDIGDTTTMLWLASLGVFMGGLLCDQVSALRRELHE